MDAERATRGLELQGIEAYYGKSHVLFDVSLSVRPGEIVFLLGRNGAGKTTTMKTAVGLLRPRSGRVYVDGRDLAGSGLSSLVRNGVAFVPEDRRLFGNMTVAENLAVAARHARGADDSWDVDRVLEVLPVIGPLLKRKAMRLSGGEQQMVAVARGLMSNPQILVLDEPMEGLAPLVVQALEQRLLALRQAGIGLLVSETQLERTLRLDARTIVIDRGCVVFEGTSEEVAADRGRVEGFLAV